MHHDKGVGVGATESMSFLKERQLLGVRRGSEFSEQLKEERDRLAVLPLDCGKECGSIAIRGRHAGERSDAGPPSAVGTPASGALPDGTAA